MYDEGAKGILVFGVHIYVNLDAVFYVNFLVLLLLSDILGYSHTRNNKITLQ